GTVVARHAALRTSVGDGPDGPMQTVHQNVPVDVPLIVVPQEHAHEHMRALAQQVFNFAEAPLWRAALLRVASEEHLFLFVAHHVILDGWSWGVMFAELADSYQGKALAPQELAYGDYVLWHRDWLSDGDRQQE